MAIIKVLIIDDEQRFLKTTQTLLEKEGYQVLTANEGQAGLDILKKNVADIVVLDVKMPGMNGIEVLRHIKSDYPLVEVLMLTGHATMETAVDGLKLGAFDYLTKPCDIPVLKQKILAAYEKRAAMLEKIQRAKFDRIISHPMEVFSKEESL